MSNLTSVSIFLITIHSYGEIQGKPKGNNERDSLSMKVSGFRARQNVSKGKST
jgi:hypothetical protein